MRTIRVLCAVIAVLAASRLGEVGAFGQCQYEITGIIQAPPCPFTGPPPTFAHGLSNNGIVVGRYEICGITAHYEAFVWTPNPDGNGGTFKTLPRPANVISASASAVNSAGFIVGSHSFQEGGTRGFIYDPITQEFKYLHPLDPKSVGITLSTVTAINDENIVVGSRRISPPGVQPPVSNAVIWYPYGEDGDGREVVFDLGVGDGPSSGAEDGTSGTDCAGWTGSSAVNVNAMAQIWTEGIAIPLGVLPDTIQSSVKAVNDRLEAIGSCRVSQGGPFLAFYWANGVMKEFEPPDGYSNSAPAQLSNFGQIVGGLLPIGGNLHQAYVWQHGQFHKLSELVVNLQPGLQLTGGRRITPSGQILAGGRLNAKIVGVMLAPVGVPPADLNFDCRVDVHDLLYLLGEWGKTSSAADLNGNGTVGVPDLLILLANWDP